MNTPLCSKCKDTGLTGSRFYVDNPLCVCPMGDERRSWAVLTAQQQNERASAEAAAYQAQAAARRAARRAAR